MHSVKRQKIIFEHLLGKSWAAIARERGITRQAITNDRRKYPELWDADEGYVLERAISLCRREIAKCEQGSRKLFGNPERLGQRLKYLKRAAVFHERLSCLLPKQVARELKKAKEWQDIRNRIENA